MANTPKHALPYPAATDPVNQGAANIQALATAVDNGIFVPAGGATGSYLAKSSAADYAAGWVPLGGGFVPAGGAAGTLLQKSAATDYATQWAAGGLVPAGGAAGQVLGKSTAADYATSWQTMSGGGGPSSAPVAYGRVSGAGALIAGVGFTVSRSATGTYAVVLSVTLAVAPIVIVGNDTANPGVNSGVGFVAVYNHSGSGFNVETWNTGAVKADRQFSIAAFPVI
jgi:hypothetical protein